MGRRFTLIATSPFTISGVALSSGLFDKLKNLQVLNLEHNPIKTIAANAFATLASARVYLGDLYGHINSSDWARSSNATFCEEEYINSVCRYCKRDEYLDHFADKEKCNKENDPGKLIEVLTRKVIENRLMLAPKQSN